MAASPAIIILKTQAMAALMVFITYVSAVIMAGEQNNETCPKQLKIPNNEISESDNRHVDRNDDSCTKTNDETKTTESKHTVYDSHPGHLHSSNASDSSGSIPPRP